jgi:Na+/glutamate symporter
MRECRYSERSNARGGIRTAASMDATQCVIPTIIGPPIADFLVDNQARKVNEARERSW